MDLWHQRRDVYRRYVITEVLDHWSTVRRAYRTTLEDGTQLITSGDHRFLTDRGWSALYCFARPTHEYLGLNVGEDFEKKIVVKINAVERLRAELRSSKWSGDHIAMGTNTDPYQHAEGKYHLTQGIIGLLSEARNPFSILTKSTLILRDTALLAAAATRTHVALNFSVGCLDRSVWR